MLARPRKPARDLRSARCPDELEVEPREVVSVLAQPLTWDPAEPIEALKDRRRLSFSEIVVAAPIEAPRCIVLPLKNELARLIVPVRVLM